MNSQSSTMSCLWFNFNAEEAVNFYLSILKNSRILEISRYGDAMPQLKGKVLAISFELDGLRLQALNAGPRFSFTEAISLSVSCAEQADLDRLARGGSTSQCGRLEDKFGLSWQVVPRALITLLKDRDADKATRVIAATMKMTKLDLAAMQRAAA